MTKQQDIKQHHKHANAIRFLSADSVEKANSGHPGMPMGMADVATILFRQFLKFDVDAPLWHDRDRFILSAGHGSMLIYSLMYLMGCKGVTIDDLKNFRQLHAKTAGHPEYGHFPGLETTTGPLGQGLVNGVGMAIAEQRLAAKFGRDLVDHYCYVIAGDGCLMEGISQEAIDLAGQLELRKLIVFWDNNSITIDGDTSLSTKTDQIARFKASGWHVQEIDGHDPDMIADAIKEAQESTKPSLIACKTTIGYGAPNKQGTAKTHGAPLGSDEIAQMRKEMDWQYAPFDIPNDILSAWREHRPTYQHSQQQHQKWQERLNHSDKKQSFLQDMDAVIGDEANQHINNIKNQWASDEIALATRQSSQKAITVIDEVVSNLLGGSADLTGSNLTKIDTQSAYQAPNYDGDYIYYGIREHAMAAVMNGIALHGGMIPYGGTFLVFSDYARPAIRLSALMGIRVIYVMTHDSIGLGEDGPTHQPVEHLASLRAIPNLLVLRPCDAVETLESWQIAINETKRPTLLCLTRQKVPALRREKSDDNLSAKGAYIIYHANKKADITILSSGSEASLAVEAAQKLASEHHIHANVVSMVCWELFNELSADERDAILGDTPRIAIEAALSFGWHQYLRGDDIFIGMESFGASAPADDLYRHFGITSDAVIEAAQTLLKA